jgi:hypothetical protein
MPVAIKMAVLVVIIQKKKARTRMGILDRQKKKREKRAGHIGEEDVAGKEG